MPSISVGAYRILQLIDTLVICGFMVMPSISVGTYRILLQLIDTLVICGYRYGNAHASMSIATIGVEHLCVRGSRVPTGGKSNRRPLEDMAGLSLFRHSSTTYSC
jgi:hypothetical protein